MKRNRWAKWALLGLAAGLIIWGAATGQAASMLHKAIRICLECMGLGV